MIEGSAAKSADVCRVACFGAGCGSDNSHKVTCHMSGAAVKMNGNSQHQSGIGCIDIIVAVEVKRGTLLSVGFFKLHGNAKSCSGIGNIYFSVTVGVAAHLAHI